MSFHGDGIYFIEHAEAPLRLDMAAGHDKDGTAILGWNVAEADHINQLWLIQSVQSGDQDTYTIRNLMSGTYMDLSGGSTNNGTEIFGWRQSTGPPGDNQVWVIKPGSAGVGYYKIQSKVGKTFVDLKDGGRDNGTRIQGWWGQWDDNNGNQRWTFKSQSLSSSEVHAALLNNPYLRRDFKSYITDGVYLILSHTLLESIWREAGLQHPARRWREDVFDCDDFAFVYKAEIAKWGDRCFKADKFAILCGVMFGSSPTGAHAYNWMINPGNHSQIEFFEPQKGTFMDNPGYSAYFGVF